MKRLISLILALALALSVVSTAFAAGSTFTTAYFSRELPDGWEYDTDKEGIEEAEGEEYLGLFGSTEDVGLIAMAYMAYYEELKDMSLWNSSDAEIKEYADWILELFEDDDPVLLDTVMAGSIPFVMFKASDEFGDYLYAETVTNGYVIEFEVYIADFDGNVFPMKDADIEQFKTILTTFKPIS